MRDRVVPHPLAILLHGSAGERDAERRGRYTDAAGSGSAMSRTLTRPAPTAVPGPPEVRERLLQRQPSRGEPAGLETECEHCNEATIQRSTAGLGVAGAAPRIVHDVLRSPGRPLDSKTRSFMDSRFNHSFGDVRVHTDARAAESARSVGAVAYTVGSDIVFGDKQYVPERPSGQRLLAHELAHVVQQRGAPPGVQAKLEIGPVGDRFEREAEAAADRVSGSQPAAVSGVAQVRLQRASEGDGVEAGSPAGTLHAGAGPLIVDDDAPGSGQMKKGQFLELLRREACAAADAELVAVGRSTGGCPYIERWIAKYQNAPAAQLERAVRKYAPESSGVTAAGDYIPLVTSRIRRGVQHWAATGDLSDVPEELQNELPGSGVLGAIGGAIAAIGGFVSNIGKTVAGIFTKAREGGPQPAADPAGVQSQLNGGAPLDAGVRGRMETALSHDFSRVRVHTDSTAARLSANLNARAFAVGSDVAFGSGEYRPGTLLGDALIAHELAHVAQQDGGGALRNSNALEEDADRSAAAAVAGMWAGQPADARPQLQSGLALQRCGGCPKEWQDKIKWAKGKGSAWVNTAAAKLDQAISAPDKIEDLTARHLRGKFLIDVSIQGGVGQLPKDALPALKSIRQAFSQVQEGFAGNPPFSCDTGTDRPKVLGDVSGWGIDYLTRKFSDVQLRRPWFEEKDENIVVATIVHEMFHKYAGKSDEAKGMTIYFCPQDWDSGAHQFGSVSSQLTTSDALGIADMYAMFAFSVSGGTDYCKI